MNKLLLIFLLFLAISPTVLGVQRVYVTIGSKTPGSNQTITIVDAFVKQESAGITDTTPPSLQLINPTGTYTYYTSLPLSYSASATDLDYCQYYVMKGNNVEVGNTTLSTCANTTFSVGGNGNYQLVLYAFDTSTNNNMTSTTFTVAVTETSTGGGGGGGRAARRAFLENMTTNLTETEILYLLSLLQPTNITQPNLFTIFRQARKENTVIVLLPKQKTSHKILRTKWYNVTSCDSLDALCTPIQYDGNYSEILITYTLTKNENYLYKKIVVNLYSKDLQKKVDLHIFNLNYYATLPLNVVINTELHSHLEYFMELDHTQSTRIVGIRAWFLLTLTLTALTGIYIKKKFFGGEKE